MNQQNVELIQSMEDAWCEKDIPRLQSLFTEDCVYEDMALGAVNHGRSGIVKFAGEVYGTFPDFQVRFVKKIAVDDAGASEWVIEGTWSGPFEGRDCTGKKIRFTGLSWYEFRDGKISMVKDCWDYTVFIKAFGVLPEALRKLK